MNNTFEASFDAIFGEPDTLDNASESTQKSYCDWADGMDACIRGLPCPPGASKSFLAGYGHEYQLEQRHDREYGENR